MLQGWSCHLATLSDFNGKIYSKGYLIFESNDATFIFQKAEEARGDRINGLSDLYRAKVSDIKNAVYVRDFEIHFVYREKIHMVSFNRKKDMNDFLTFLM